MPNSTSASDANNTGENLIGGAMPLEQLIILGIISGLSLEISFSGIISVTQRLLTPTAESFRLCGTIMILFNIFCIVYQSLFNWGYFLNQHNCEVGNLWANIASHLFYFTFGCFLLFKAYSVSHDAKWVKLCSLLIIINRIVWGVLDIWKSYGAWDASLDQCIYYQNRITGVGYFLADLISDIFCTLVSIACSYKFLNSDITKIGEVIISENVIRSIIVLATTSYEIYATWTFTDPFLCWLAYILQTWVFTRVLNCEFFWIQERQLSIYSPVEAGGGSKGQLATTTTPTTGAPSANSSGRRSIIVSVISSVRKSSVIDSRLYTRESNSSSKSSSNGINRK
ncbi:hypothetical protein BDR26DRAFT_524427 [Obelidium mucronatum]|nr:hypothetical protein BDR26DRAFT_524427 [Obelidium mucronatum]